MASREHVQYLMQRIGAQLDLGEVQEFLERDLWTLAFDHDLVMEVDFDEAHKKIVIAGPIGRVEGHREGLYELLLQYNYSWERTGGARMAMAGPQGEIYLAFDVSVIDLDLPSFQTVLESVREAILQWRTVFDRFNAGAGGSTDLLQESEPAPAAIKV